VKRAASDDGTRTQAATGAASRVPGLPPAPETRRSLRALLGTLRLWGSWAALPDNSNECSGRYK
jgi:hypothetical protein